MHPDIGKKVRGDGLIGTLVAVDCDNSERPHLIQCDDGYGWTFTASDTEGCYQSARKQGVKDDKEILRKAMK